MSSLRGQRMSSLWPGLTQVRASLRVVTDHPRLLVIPAITAIGGGLVFLPLLWALNRGSRLLLLVAVRSFGPVALAGIPLVFALSAWVFLSVYAMIALSASTVFVACTRQILENDSVSLSASVRVATRVTPHLFVFALAFGAVGLLLAGVERASDGIGDIVASVFGASVAVLTFFVVPATVLDGAAPREALDRSVETVRDSFGQTSVLSLGMVGTTTTVFAIPYFVAVLAVPFIGVDRTSALIEAYPVLFGGALMFSLWVGVIAGVSLGAIAKTALYITIRDGEEVVPLLDIPVERAVSTGS